ncbi:DNA polymerase delta subunit 3-like [Eurosta solidaginis]|uniref:DNA polymerase delta subunit 3-like n=1 Tax=Eurosta solidaginis TaxID=178769 RepID=UPI0035308072
MCAAKLKEALNDCKINFDVRVLLTDLINEYEIPIDDVSDTLIDYCKEQEKDGVKFEKRYVVHGMEAEDANIEVFKIVKGQDKLNEWLDKLKDVESTLYSVEKVGGSKSPAEDLKPVKWCAVKLDGVETRTTGSKPMNGNATKAETIKAAVKGESKPESKPAKGIANAFAKPRGTTRTEAKNEYYSTSASNIVPGDNKKNSPQDGKKNEENAVKSPQKTADPKKISPKEKKAAAAAVGQKNIGNFFAPKGKATVDAAKKPESQKSPKKLNDYFKKQADKPTAATKTAKGALQQEEKEGNTSIQLFEDDDEAVAGGAVKEGTPMEVNDESSDEEEELNKLRRKVAAVDEEAGTSSRKRLRIEDSDDEDDIAIDDADGQQPQQKQGKLDESATVKEAVDSPPKSETYLDEDGFVITVKSKKSATKKPSTKPKTPQKTPSKASPKAGKNKQTPKLSAKTKQGNIMNFFKKK